MTDLDLESMERAAAEARLGRAYYEACYLEDVPRLIAEIRRLRADLPSLRDELSGAQAHIAELTADLAREIDDNAAVEEERNELAACLRIAMERWSDLYEEHKGSRSPDIESFETYERCRAALKEAK
jgi:chromosome segregation ATPase